jgi:hypothetical protein
VTEGKAPATAAATLLDATKSRRDILLDSSSPK